MTRRTTPAVLRLALLAVAAPALAVFAWPRPATAAFHLIEFVRVMTGWNGDATVQAVELRMQTGGQNFVAGGTINAYNAAGTFLGTLGTFPANVPFGNTDSRVLCATSAFQTTFGITADLTITAGIPVGTGQVAFEEGGCFVNSIAYGNVTAPKSGTTSAQAIPTDLAYALVRTVANGTLAACPLAEDSALKMALRSGSAAAPIVFTNNAGTSVNVFSTQTGVDGSPRPLAVGIFPNPVRSTARVTAPMHRRLVIHDVRGRIVAVLSSGMARTVSPYEGFWDGRDAQGVEVPSGIYFLRYDDLPGTVTRRFAVVR